ncbi:unnamed protein product [Adineta steineri]|uniref:Uncharacterized protein n=1 Tax=Adineta steineri TaxID=433720 RepID=A0A813XDE4_9BILA|nr:unnamed protein product [Adineta steineri]
MFISGGRAIGAIIGIISACSLFVLLFACCIVYYRRYLTRKARNEQTNTEQPQVTNRTANYMSSDPPPYSEAVKVLSLTCTDGKGFGGGRGGGGFKGGSRGGGSFGGSKGAGTFGGSSGYGGMNKVRTGSSFGSNARSFGMGALGGVAAYSLMNSMSSHRSYRPGYYDPGYGTGSTCINNENRNGTTFGSFRCPLNGFPIEARSCCGPYGNQFCCIPDGYTSDSRHYRSSFGGILLVIIIVAIIVFIFVRHRRRSQKDVVMVPMEPPLDEEQRPPFYHPPPPPMGYPPPPMGYPQPPHGNPYAPPPQNYDGSYNPYPQQQHQMPYPPQQQPYPPQQQSYNPYQVKEGGPPAYNDAMVYNQGYPATKPM